MKDKQEAQVTPELVAAQWSKFYRESEIFRADFDEDPKAAVAKLIGQDFPPDMEIVVHRSKAGQVHVVVPDEIPGDIMGDEQLAGISGGDYFGGGGHDDYGYPARGDNSWRYSQTYLDSLDPRSGLPRGSWHHNRWLEINGLED